MGKRGEAMRIYSGRELKDRAVMWVRLHRRMTDYLKQAPIIVLADDDPDTRLTLYRLCERGAKLRDVVEACGFNIGLRGVHPYALRRFEVPRGFVDAKPSAIAQQVSSRTIDGQREYIRNLCTYAQSRNFNQDRGVPLAWMAENLPKGQHDMRHYADIPAMTLEECGFRRNWRWRDFKAAIKKWEEEYERPDFSRIMTQALARVRAGAPTAHEIMLRSRQAGATMRLFEERLRVQMEQAAMYGSSAQYVDQGSTHTTDAIAYAGVVAALTEPLTPHTDVVKEAEDQGLSFHLLNTRGELAGEGRAMQHCVGGYGDNVRSGRSLIYSIRKNGQHLATMELSPSSWDSSKQDRAPEVNGWCVEQVKGVRNAAPDAATLQAANAFAAAHFKIVPRKPTLERWWLDRMAMTVMRPNPAALYTVTS